jgi:nitrite reductase/ring-hydroxylating ferredoxin subunit/uncharacterized membrane protein
MSTVRDLLEGKPFGHPLHPILVHLPIGLFVIGFLLDIGAFVHPSHYLVVGATATLTLGVAFALIASVPGFVDYTGIRRDHPARSTATWHMVLNLLAVGAYVWSVLLRTTTTHYEPTMLRPRLDGVVLSLIGLGIISVSGYLGGVLVYDDGIAVGRHRRRGGSTPLDTIKPATSTRDADGFVPIADVSQLEEHGTLRAEVNGVVMAIAKVNGQLYAFQEFCTHRYGPLSKGCFVGDCQIKCPWHGSQFDMRTGKAVEGPAKVDLKVFEVTVRSGKIAVRV